MSRPDPGPRLADGGAQPERTLLAWRRTILALAAGIAVEVRFSIPAVGWVAAVVGVLAVGAAILAWMSVTARYRGMVATVRGATGHRLPGLPGLPGGALPLAATAFMAGLFGLVLLVTALVSDPNRP